MLTNGRILSIENGHVCFRHQEGQDHRWKPMTLPALEFIRRFLQHELPKGFHKVCYYDSGVRSIDPCSTSCSIGWQGTTPFRR